MWGVDNGGLSHKIAHEPGELCRLVLGDERVGVVNLDEAGVWQQPG